MNSRIFVIAIFWAWAINVHAQTINDFYEDGVKLQEQGKYIEAIAKFSDVVKKDKFYHEAWYHRALCYIEQKKIRCGNQRFNRSHKSQERLF